MSKLWLTKDIIGWDKREILVWNHRLNHFSFKSLLRLPKRGVIPGSLADSETFSLVLPEYLEVPTIGHGVSKANTQADQ